MGVPRHQLKLIDYVCSKCGWTGKRRGKISQALCRKCGHMPHPVSRPRGRPKKRRNIVPVPNVVLGEYSGPKSVRTSLNQGLLDSVCKTVQASKVHPEVAAMAQGIPKQTFHDWRKQGAEDLQNNRSTIFAELTGRLEKARAEGEVDLLNQAEDLAKGNKASWMRTYRHLESWSRDRWVKSERLELEARLVDVDTVPDRPAGIGGFLDRARLQGGVAGELQAGAVDAEFAEIPVSDGTKGDKAAESSGDQVGTDAQMDQGPASSSEA